MISVSYGGCQAIAEGRDFASLGTCHIARSAAGDQATRVAQPPLADVRQDWRQHECAAESSVADFMQAHRNKLMLQCRQGASPEQLANGPALNNSQCIDLVQQSPELDAVELHGLVGPGGKPCDSRRHEAPPPLARTRRPDASTPGRHDRHAPRAGPAGGADPTGPGSRNTGPASSPLLRGGPLCTLAWSRA